KEQRLRNATVALDAAVGDERHAVGGGKTRLDERFDLRHAKVCSEPGGAAAAWTDTDLDPVHTALEQKLHASSRRHIAGDDLDRVKARPNLFNGLLHHA